MVVSRKEYKIIKTMKRWFVEEVGKPYEFIVDICGKMLEEIEVLKQDNEELKKDIEVLKGHIRQQEEDNLIKTEKKNDKLKRLKEMSEGIGGEDYEIKL